MVPVESFDQRLRAPLPPLPCSSPKGQRWKIILQRWCKNALEGVLTCGFISPLWLSLLLTHFDTESTTQGTEILQSLPTCDLWSSEVESWTPFTPEALKIVGIRDGPDFNLIHCFRLQLSLQECQLCTGYVHTLKSKTCHYIFCIEKEVLPRSPESFKLSAFSHMGTLISKRSYGMGGPCMSF